MPRSHALATLRHRDFMLLWVGQLVSSTGDMMQNIALAWNMWLLTSSPLMVGLIAACRAVPSILLSMYGGALADIMERKRLLMWGNAVQMTVTCVLVAAAFTGHVTAGLLFGIAFAGGGGNAFTQPARSALVPNVVPPEELADAYTLLTLLRQVANVAGPGAGGITIAVLGLGATYLSNAGSFLAVIIALLLMGPIPMVRASSGGSNLERIAEGLRFAWHEPLLMVPLAIDGLTRLVVSFQPLLPILASVTFSMGPQGLGWLQAASSTGAVVGGLAIGTGHYGRRPLRVMVIGYAIEGLFVTLLGCSPLLIGAGRLPAFGIALAALFGNGVCDVISEVTRFTVAQFKTPDELRGRVNAFSSIVTGGFPSLGQLEMGGVADAFGPVVAAVCGGLAATAITIACLAPRGPRRAVLGYEFAPPTRADEALAAS